jgi:hypothetical protein
MEDTNLLFDFVPVTTHHACCIDSLAYMLLDFCFGLPFLPLARNVEHVGHVGL